MRYLLLTTLFFLFFGCGASPSNGKPRIVVTATKVTKMDVPIYRDYVGHASANASVDIYAQVSGTLMSQHFTGGEMVKAGDILFTIDSRPYIAQLQKAESNLEQNIASLQIAKQKAESYTQLIKEDIISQLEYDQSLTDVLNLEAQINQDKANIDLAKINLRHCNVRATINGYASISSIGVGTYVPIGGTTPLVTLQQVTPMGVSFYVPEADLLRIRALKQKRPLRVQAFSIKDTGGRVFEGTLTLIDNNIDEQTGTIWMLATFPNKDATMWPNEYFKTRLFLTTVKDALVVPEEAIVKTQTGDQIFIIKEDMTVEVRPITVGESFNNFFIVEKGVEEGEIVVLQGQLNLIEGTGVTIKGDELIPIKIIEEERPEFEEISPPPGKKFPREKFNTDFHGRNTP